MPRPVCAPPGPYLLYIGSSTDALEIKTSRGIAQFRPDLSIGEFRHDDCPMTLGLPRMSFEEAKAAGAGTLVLGVANAGGRLHRSLIADGLAALEAGLDLAAGLHSKLRDEPRLAKRAAELGRSLFDVRDMPADLPVGNGAPRAGHRLLTVGTDCSVGKMYTSLALVRGLEARGIDAAFCATGQTGIFVAGGGVALDAVIADFMAGAVEQLTPAREDGGWDVVEGQGSLFHPSFAGVSTALLHGAQPEALVLCHEPGRPHMRGLPYRQLPQLMECLRANVEVARLTSPNVRAVGVALNTAELAREDARRLCDQVSLELELPCLDPMRDDIAPILDRLLA